MVVFGKNSPDQFWSVDSYGYRPDFRQSDKGGSRILVLGDSYTYSDGATHFGAYPAQMEAELLRQGINVNVINAGVPGYGSDQIYNRLLELVPILRPKLVLWNLYQNDITDANYFCLYRFNQDRELVEYPTWKNNIYRQGWLLTAVPSWLSRGKLFQAFLAVFGYAYGGDGKMPVATVGCTQQPNQQVDLEMAQKTMVMIDHARKVVEQSGGQLMVVNLPFHHAYGPQSPEYIPEHDRDSLLRQIPIDINVAACDAKTGFGQKAHADLGSQLVLSWFQTDAEDGSPHKHPNSLGYAALGEVTADCVAAKLTNTTRVIPACLRP